MMHIINRRDMLMVESILNTVNSVKSAAYTFLFFIYDVRILVSFGMVVTLVL